MSLNLLAFDEARAEHQRRVIAAERRVQLLACGDPRPARATLRRRVRDRLDAIRTVLVLRPPAATKACGTPSSGSCTIAAPTRCAT